MRQRPLPLVVEAVVVVVLLVATVLLVALGVQERPSTGELLTAPVATVQLDGGLLALAAVCASAAVLTAVDLVARLRRG